jgi:hypothetical protein
MSDNIFEKDLIYLVLNYCLIINIISVLSLHSPVTKCLTIESCSLHIKFYIY